MPGSREFSRAMRGNGSEPIQTGNLGAMETNNYGGGGGFSHDGTAYPYTLDPAAYIEEISLTQSANIVMRITTSAGDTFDIEVHGNPVVFDHWSIDTVEFRDPNATAAPISGGWAGE